MAKRGEGRFSGTFHAPLKALLSDQPLFSLPLSVIVLCAATLAALLCGPEPAFPFSIPERLEFVMEWQGMYAGNSTMEITEEGDSLKIISVVTSSPLVSKFYPVEDRVEAKIAKPEPGKSFGRSMTYRMKIREGWHRRDKELVFDHAARKVLYRDNLKEETRLVEIGEGALDPLSAVYYVRSLPLEVGKSGYVDIFDSKKMWHVEIMVLRKERIRVPAGEFDTVVVKPLLKSEGIFPSRRGEVLIWLTDDPRRIPVRITMRVVVGSVTVWLEGGKF